MNTLIKRKSVKSALVILAMAGTISIVHAQEAALVYASNVTATNSLNDISTKVTPQMLARDYTSELIADMDVRLPVEQSEFSETLRIRHEFEQSLLDELNVRLKQEMLNFTASLAI